VGIGLGLMIGSGSILFWNAHDYLLHDSVFYIKMAFVLALIVNSLVIERSIDIASKQPFNTLTKKTKTATHDKRRRLDHQLGRRRSGCALSLLKFFRLSVGERCILGLGHKHFEYHAGESKKAWDNHAVMHAECFFCFYNFCKLYSVRDFHPWPCNW